MLQIGVSSYEYTNDWKKFNEIPLPEKKENVFYSILDIEYNTCGTFWHIKKKFENDSEIESSGGWHDFCV